jgi:hypothetical protein
MAACVTGAAGLLLGLGAPAAVAGAATPIHMTVPFYPPYPGYNDPGWGEIENAAPAGTVANAVVNFCDASGNGPGCNNMPWGSKNTSWDPAIAGLRAAGVNPMGYTWSSYDMTPIATVEKEILDWVKWYSVKHIFVDGASTNDHTYYCNLAKYAINHGVTQFEINPGTNITSSKYECAGTVAAGKVVIDSYEGQGGPAFSSWTAPAWMAKYPGDLAVTLATPGQTTSGMQADLAHAQTEGAAYFYEGTDTLYASLPGFFGQEVTAVAGS